MSCDANFVVVIPARYASTRLPGKPLLPIAGWPMIRHVHDRALESGAAVTVIATDDARVYQAATTFGATVLMTGTHHRSGTERLAEVVDLLQLTDATVVVNLQGDEPLVPVPLIRQVAQAAHQHPSAAIATLCAPIVNTADLFDPHVVKVIRDTNGYAAYFSRAPIPWNRDGFTEGALCDHTAYEQSPGWYYRHIGLYAYRAGFIRAYCALPPSPWEQLESLEQLRALYHGHRIYVEETTVPPGPGVDTPADLERVRALFVAAS